MGLVQPVGAEFLQIFEHAGNRLAFAGNLGARLVISSMAWSK